MSPLYLVTNVVSLIVNRHKPTWIWLQNPILFFCGPTAARCAAYSFHQDGRSWNLLCRISDMIFRKHHFTSKPLHRVFDPHKLMGVSSWNSHELPKDQRTNSCWMTKSGTQPGSSPASRLRFYALTKLGMIHTYPPVALLWNSQNCAWKVPTIV